MAIEYVGGQVAGIAGRTSETTVTFALTGGIASVPAADDLVIVTYGVATLSADVALYVKNASGGTAYTLIGTELFSSDSSSSNLHSAYRFMPATPETSCVLSQTGNNQYAGVYTIHVFRNVDQTTPMDVTVVTATGGNSLIANPAAITPLASGAKIYVAGVGAAPTTIDANYTTAELSSFLSTFQIDSFNAIVGAGYFTWSSGAFDPAAFGYAGTDSIGNSWCAVTAALRPKPPITVAIIQATETDLAQAMVVLPLRIMVGQATETDLAQGVARVKTRSITQATETDLAQAMGRLKFRAIGQASETDIAQIMTRMLNLALPTIQTVYAPRPLITLTIAAATKRYSTETLETP